MGTGRTAAPTLSGTYDSAGHNPTSRREDTGMTRRPNNPMAIDRYARFCAPTTLAALLDISREEAAEYLTDAGGNTGTGGTDHDVWCRVLESFGGMLVACYLREFARGRPTDRPTVAQFLREHSHGTFVLWTTQHTLLARDGQVVCDTRSTRSQRARMYRAYRFPS